MKQGCYDIFYTPEGQYPGMPHGEMCGDLMPFYKDGTFTLLYLYKYCIYAVETKDFVHYGHHRLVLQNGTPDEQDWHAATGSVVACGDRFYFYYTGFCETNRGEAGKFEQAILRAVSTDLHQWKKDAKFFFPPDTAHYAPTHWRDPQIFWSEERQQYCMLVTAAEKDKPACHAGCTALYTSVNCLQWAHEQTLYAPRTFLTHECQDAFSVGGRWYLVFSNYTRQWETRYRVADRFEGPWQLPPADDRFDGRMLYAAKTVSDGQNRYLVGWLSIRKDCRDAAPCVWGGNVVVHQLAPRPDGSLGTVMVPAIHDAFTAPQPLALHPWEGRWTAVEGAYQGSSPDGFGWAGLGCCRGTCLFEGTFTWEAETAAFGLMLHTSGPMLEKWCQLRIEPKRGRIQLDRYNRIDGDQSYEDERPIAFTDRRARVQVILSGTILQAYVEDVALTTRCYEIEQGGLGLFIEYGEVTCRTVKLLALPAAD